MNEDEQQPQTSGMLAVGIQLRQAREAVGLAIDDVSSLLHISTDYVHAIEHDQYEKLPAPIYVKGYIRNYAKLVQIDGDQLIRAYEEKSGAVDAEKSKPEELVSLSPTIPKGVDLQWLGFGALILVLVVVFLAISTDNQDTDVVLDDVHTAVQNQQAEQVESSAEKKAVDESLSAGNSETSGKPSELLNEAGEQTDLEVLSPLSDTAIVSDPSALTEAETDEDEPVTGTDTLFMFFSGECWVSVKDAYDLEIYAALKKSGESLELSGVAPFRVLLGNATVVNLNFNGKNIALEPYTRKDSGTAVVRLRP